MLGYDPYLSDENAKMLGIEKVDSMNCLAGLILCNCTPLTDATRNIVSADALNKTKRRADY